VSVQFAGLPTTTESITRAVLRIAGEHGMSAVRYDEFPFVHDMASRLMDHDVSSVETFRAVQAIQPASSLCYREDGVVTGVLGLLLLRATALDQLMHGTFDGKDIDFDLLSRGAERPAVGYAWGIAATSRTAGAAVTAFSGPLGEGATGGITFVARAVTEVGRHVALTRFGFRPLRHPDDDMLISYPAVMEAAE